MISWPGTTRSTPLLKREPVNRQPTTIIWTKSQHTMPKTVIISKEKTSLVISQSINLQVRLFFIKAAFGLKPLNIPPNPNPTKPAHKLRGALPASVDWRT